MKMKCPKCGAIFEGPVSFCPSCGTKLAMPAQSEPVVAQPVVQAAPVAAAPVAPAQPKGSKGKAIGFGIVGLLFSVGVLVCDLFLVFSSIASIIYVSTPEVITEDIATISAAAITFGWIFAVVNLPFAIMGLIFGNVSARQKVVKGLGTTAKVFGILAFVFYFVSGIAVVASVITAVATVGCAVFESTDWTALELILIR